MNRRGRHVEPSHLRNTSLDMPSSTRTNFWSADVKARYWQDKRQHQDRADAEHAGREIAEIIDDVLAGLTQEEHDFIFFLAYSNMRTIIATHDVTVLERLVSKKLLRLRPGVGTMFMQSYQTSFSVPSAIWSALTERRDSMADAHDTAAGGLIEELRQRLGDQLEGIVPIELDAFDES